MVLHGQRYCHDALNVLTMTPLLKNLEIIGLEKTLRVFREIERMGRESVEGQAMELFSTLQVKGVESKFLYFPDEFHFVVKPQNAQLWWKTIFDWLNQHKK